MNDLKFIVFKHGLFWYACCVIPAKEIGETLYYDNKPYTIPSFPIVLHTRGLTYNKAAKKLADKIEEHYKKEKNND